MACEQWRDKLDRYVDGELSSADAAAFAEHLRSCHACAGDVLERVQLKRSVQVAGKRYTPSPQLRNKIVKKLGAKSRPGFAWRMPAMAALILLLAAVALNPFFARERMARQRAYSELADLHVATLAS